MPDEHVLTPTLKVDGQEKIGGEDIKTGARIRSIQVDQRLDTPDYFSVDFQIIGTGAEQDLSIVDDLKLGMKVTIGLDYRDRSTIFNGTISYIEPQVGNDRTLARIAGFDFVDRPTHGWNFQLGGEPAEPTDARAVDSDDTEADRGTALESVHLPSKAGPERGAYFPLVAIGADSSLRSLGVSTGFVTQSCEKQTKQVGFVLIDTSPASKATVYFQKIEDKEKGLRGIKADFKHTTERECAMVEVHGWDQKNSKTVIARATSAGAKSGSVNNGRVLTIVNSTAQDEASASKIAQTLCDDFAAKFTRGTIIVDGASPGPEVVVGDIIRVEQFDKTFDGKYLVEAVTHSYDFKSYSRYMSVIRFSNRW